MKTKSLLIAAATLAVGVITSQAAVYSQNVVGYYNVTVPAKGFYMIGSQLNLDNTNSINTLFSGLISDGNGVNNSVIWLWNPVSHQYSSFQYFTGADADNNFLTSGSVNGFYDTSGNLQPATLPVGQGAFIENHGNTSPLTFTVAGNVAQGTNTITFNQGYTMVCAPVPISTNICSTNINFVGTSDGNAVNNDVIWLWNPTSKQYSSFQYFTGADADNNFLTSGSVTGFYDTSGNLQNIAPLVGSGFFIQHIVATPETWTNIFQVQ